MFVLWFILREEASQDELLCSAVSPCSLNVIHHTELQLLWKKKQPPEQLCDGAFTKNILSLIFGGVPALIGVTQIGEFEKYLY